MATNFLELATTLKSLGAKWLPHKKLILRPVLYKLSREHAVGNPSVTECQTANMNSRTGLSVLCTTFAVRFRKFSEESLGQDEMLCNLPQTVFPQVFVTIIAYT